MSAPATASAPVFSPWLRGFAQIVSVVFHPLFLPMLVSAWILLAHPIHTLLLEEPMRVRMLAMVGINTILFPALILLLLWRLGFIPGIQLENQRDRVLPLVISIIFYFWAWYVARNLSDYPAPLRTWLLGVFLISCAAMFTNIFLKISLHGLGMGGLIVFGVMMTLNDPYWPVWWLPVSLVVAGLVGAARLLREAHRPGEVYAGYLAGAICMAVAWMASN